MQKQLELNPPWSGIHEALGDICIWLAGPYKTGHALLTRSKNTAERKKRPDFKCWLGLTPRLL